MKKFLIALIVIVVCVIGCDLAVTQMTKASESEAQAEQEAADEDAYEEIAEMIQDGNTEEALSLLEEQDTESAEYYLLKELAYIEDGSEEADEQLSELYKEAADRWPEWQHMQKMAGVAALFEGNYESAEYRLFVALRLDTEDAETWFYLGELAYCEGNYEDMRTYFESALEYGLSETKQSEILWYAKQVGDLE
ncbi:MAG: hypothetical protein LUG54_03660 [Clostridiales bacterium]|nr:hypothetical protein [Clostridiales bacterium]